MRRPSNVGLVAGVAVLTATVLLLAASQILEVQSQPLQMPISTMHARTSARTMPRSTSFNRRDMCQQILSQHRPVTLNDVNSRSMEQKVIF
mmetsp:Transcript_40874/g.65706  ORF Transcript_40874/g.65706 Transcript_40874/m.65706 type:complete len:91 (+) Transcript_40874:42-314(+)